MWVRFAALAAFALLLLAMLATAGDPKPLLIEDVSARPLEDVQHFDAAWAAEARTVVSASPLWPPDQFRGDNAALVILTGREGIAKMCGAPPEGIARFACSGMNKDGVPIIASANPCLFPEDDFFAGLLCHELGHQNGWRPAE